jgi:P4 family phage/plasmid primase-like protien
MKTSRALKEFLNARRSSSKNYTHLSQSPNGKYVIQEAHLDTLYKLIAAEAQPPHILEGRSGLSAGPLLIDLDFAYPDELRFHTRQYTRAHICRFVDLLHTTITYFYGDDIDIEYVVSEKPRPTIETGKRVKDGLHILGKGVIFSYADQEKLREYILQKHILQEAFPLEYTTNSAADIYDKAVVATNGWYLHGCSKPGRDPYMPTMAFVVAEPGVVRWVERDVSSYTARDLSIRYPSGQIATVLIGWPSAVPMGAAAAGESVSQVRTVVPARTDITGGKPAFIESYDVLAKLVGMWSSERATRYDTWRNAIFCIATCGKVCGNSPGALELAHTFSQQAPNYDASAVNKLFLSEKRGSLSFIVAHQWAKNDNFIEYMGSGLVPWWKVPWAHYTVAREFYGNFPDTFLFVNGYWYYFNGVYWEKDAGCGKGDSKTIKRLMSTLLYDILYEQIKMFRETIDAAEYQRKLTVLNMLYNKAFKNDVISELEQFYGYSDVKFNQMHELFPFNNRVFDLSTGDWVKPTSDMYVSITTGYDYVEVADTEIETMERWVGELFDSEEKTRYVLTFLASCLRRGNREETATFWLGRGRNGKSCLKEMMNAAFGAFTGNIDTAYFTAQEKACSAANPHIYNLQHSRILFCDEAETDGRVTGKFSTGRMKKLTGGDDLVARNIYDSEEVKFKAGSFVALVNEMPRFTSIDFALLARIVCIVFPYHFMPADVYNADDPTHKKQDPTIKENILAKRDVFINMLLKWYRIYMREGLVKPACVIAETGAVTSEMDSVGGWAKLNLVFKSGTRTPVRILYDRYVENNQNGSSEIIGSEEFGKRIKRCYEVKRCRHGDDYGVCSRVIGYTLKENEEG